MKNLFIDSNIWLSLFYFSNDDLEQFRKLRKMLGTDINIFVPEQILNEVYRNRENRIKDALEKFEKFELQFPVFIKNYSEYEEFQKKYSNLKKEHKEWLIRVKNDISEQTTPADIVLKEFFNSVNIIPSKPEIIQAGVLRYDIGNPPGKDKKYGDAINWETLLSSVPDGEDLFFISADKDYASVYDESCFNPFLAKEWEEKKKSKITLFKSLVDFLNAHVKEIHLKEETKKNDLIESLVHSRNFTSTHNIVKSLSHYSDWTIRQAEDLCGAAVDNFQVSWILGDDDIFEFYSRLLDSNAAIESTDLNVYEVKKEIEKQRAIRDVID